MIHPHSRPTLAKKTQLRVDPITQRTVLLAPEKGLVLNRTAAAISALCDGEHSFQTIIDEICAAHPSADRARVESEVVEFLQSLAERCLLELQP